MDKQSYEKGGSAESDGSQFQVHLLVVSLLNTVRMRFPNWRIDKGGGKFDDVVLEWSDGAVLLQAKHREGKKSITVDQLLSTTSKNDGFSIPKYFLSYQEIKNKFPMLRKAVICTNASANENALIFLNSHTNSSESILYYEGAQLFYTLKDYILSELKDKMKTYYNQNLRDKEVEYVITDETLKDFQNHFQIYFDFPSDHDVGKVVEKLLNKISWSTKISVSEIYCKVTDWLQRKDYKIFTELHAKAMLSEIRTDRYWQSLKQYDVHFPHNDLNFADSNRRYHFIAERTYLLQEIRIWQALRGEKALYIHPDDSVEDQKLLIDTFGLPNYTILIIVQSNESIVMQLWDQIEQILINIPYKKIVLLTARDNKLVRLIRSSNNSFDVIKEPPIVEDLLTETRDRLLRTRNILFQGKCVSLEDLFAPRSFHDFRTSLESEILDKLVKGEQIRVGSELPVLEKEVERSYIPRKFVRKNEERHEENIFEANDKLIVIAGGPGTGKSTSLTKLAVLIKESNPHLWVVKIVLDHYFKIPDSLRKQRAMGVDVTEFLDSQEATKPTNQLELDKLVFSMKNKVVLMLDGLEEVHPYWSPDVESLLVNCLRAPNVIKIFATTWPGMGEKLEKKLQVKSFELVPFSQRNQIDLFRSYWIHNLGDIDREKCEQYARILVSKMSSWTDSYGFASIPLRVKMAAEIFQKNRRDEGVKDWEGCQEFLNSDALEPKLPQKLGLARLYKLFIERKKNQFLDTLNAEVEDTATAMFNSTLAFHRTLALEVTFDESTRNLFSCYKEGGKNWVPKALKMGIIQEVDNALCFVHRTFALYFVAECLITELKRHNQNIEFQKFLFDKVLLNHDFKVTCIFFDGLLQDCVHSLPPDIFNTYQLSPYYNEPCHSDYLNFIHILAGKGCVAILQLLLKCVDNKVAKDKERSIRKLFRKIHKKKSRGYANGLDFFQICVQDEGLNTADYFGFKPLHSAAREGHLEMVKFLVGQGASIDTPEKQYSPLLEAAGGCHSDVVEFLVKQGADIIANVRQDNHQLYHALYNNRYGDHVRIANYLLDRILEDGSLKCARDIEDTVIPLTAAFLGRMDVLQCLVGSGMDVNKRKWYHQPLIFGAAMGGQLEVVKYLIGQGADVNSRDGPNNTILHEISSNSSLVSIGQFLVDSGVEVNAKNDKGVTALHLAAIAGDYDMAKFLIKNSADVNSAGTILDRSVLYSAALSGNLAVVDLLLEHGTNVNDIISGTLPQTCASWGQLDLLKYLVKLGVDVTAKNKSGRTALHAALSSDKVDVAKYLVDCCNVVVNSQDNDGETELHYGVSMNLHNPGNEKSFDDLSLDQLNIVKRIVARGGNFNLRNNKGQTVLYLAALSVVLNCTIPCCDECLRVITFLIEQGAVLDTESLGDAIVRLAKEIQKHARYRSESLKTILRLPVFGLLDPAFSLNDESAASSTSLCVTAVSQMAPNAELSEMTAEDEREELLIRPASRVLGRSRSTGFMKSFRKCFK